MDLFGVFEQADNEDSTPHNIFVSSIFAVFTVERPPQASACGVKGRSRNLRRPTTEPFMGGIDHVMVGKSSNASYGEDSRHQQTCSTCMLGCRSFDSVAISFGAPMEGSGCSDGHLFVWRIWEVHSVAENYRTRDGRKVWWPWVAPTPLSMYVCSPYIQLESGSVVRM